MSFLKKMNDFKKVQGLDTSRKRLSPEMLTCTIWENPNCNHLEVDQCIFIKLGSYVK